MKEKLISLLWQEETKWETQPRECLVCAGLNEFGFVKREWGELQVVFVEKWV